jgi:hypothetical protein
MTQPHQLETPTVWQRIFLQSKVNGAPYEEQQLSCERPWPENTYLQHRLAYLRTYQSSDELREPGQPSQKDIPDAEGVGWASVWDTDASLGTDGSLANPICIETPSDDWTWIANPMSDGRNT